MKKTMEIHFLGTGSAWPSRTRNVSSTVLHYRNYFFMFDCGEGTQRQLVDSSVSFMKIKAIFFTHLHGDHCFGLPGLLQTMYLNRRTSDLYIYGPEDTIKTIATMLELTGPPVSFKIYISELKEGESIKAEGLTVKAIGADHDVPANSYIIIEDERRGKFLREKAISLGLQPGPLFKKLTEGIPIELDGPEKKVITPDMVLTPGRPGRKVVISGDTRYSEKLVQAAYGADVLIHEATGMVDNEESLSEYGHSSVRQACEAAARASVRLLILTHISPRYEGEEELLLNEAQKYFQPVILARDFMVVKVPFPENPVNPDEIVSSGRN